eukprot:IDg12425t1
MISNSSTRAERKKHELRNTLIQDDDKRCFNKSGRLPQERSFADKRVQWSSEHQYSLLRELNCDYLAKWSTGRGQSSTIDRQSVHRLVCRARVPPRAGDLKL